MSRGYQSLGDAKKRPPTDRSAHTLIDMVVTCLLMGIVAAVAAPRYSSAKLQFQADAAARHLQSDLEIARSTARFKGRANASNLMYS